MPTLTVSCFEEFQERSRAQDFEITTYIYEGIKRGIKRGSRKVKIMTVIMEDDPGSWFDFYLEDSEWLNALTVCLEHYTRQELFEDCVEIKSLIDTYQKLES
jgi:hypothetical protein